MPILSKDNFTFINLRDDAPEEKAPEVGVLRKIADVTVIIANYIKNIVYFILSLAVASALIYAACKLIFLPDGIQIGPITMPAQFVSTGLTDAAASRILRDALVDLAEHSETEERQEFLSLTAPSSDTLRAELSQIKVPIADLSIGSIALFARSFLAEPDKQVVGEVTLRDGLAYLTLSYNNRLVYSSKFGKNPADIENILKDSAIEIFKEIYPKYYSLYISSMNPDEAKFIMLSLVDRSDGSARDKAHSYNILGSIFYNNATTMEDVKASLNYFRRAQEEYCHFALTYVNLAIVQLNFGLDDKAIESLKKALIYDSNSVRARQILGRTLGRRKDSEAAIKQFDAALKVAADKSLLYVDLSNAYLSADNNYEADKYVRLAVQDRVRNDSVVEYFTSYVARSPDRMSAVRLFEQMVKLHPESLENYRALAIAYSSAGDTASSIKTLRAALDHAPADQSIISRLANTYQKEKQYDLAIEYYEKWLAIDPFSAEAASGLGVVYRNQEKYDLARKYLQASVDRTKPSVVKSKIYSRYAIELAAFFKIREEFGEEQKIRQLQQAAERISWLRDDSKGRQEAIELTMRFGTCPL